MQFLNAPEKPRRLLSCSSGSLRTVSKRYVTARSTDAMSAGGIAARHCVEIRGGVV